MTEQQINPWIDLSARVALVTGAASGIGRATAIALAGAGARTLVLDCDEEGLRATVALIVESGGQANSRRLDVTSEDDWNHTVSWIGENWGRLDILVNCAGVSLSDKVGDASLEVHRKTFAINVEGSLLGMSAALHFMRKAGTGSIINLSSTASLQANPAMASYGASKAAVAHFTRSAACESIRAGHDIRINSVHPGLIDTSMADDLFNIHKEMGSPEEIVAKITTGRLGRPEEVANLILFLASDRASFISGTSINIDRAASA
jgi:NAD(P)-dependent dehydrogenase (short-subunit alcohol dehydrogenase family)